MGNFTHYRNSLLSNLKRDKKCLAAKYLDYINFPESKIKLESVELMNNRYIESIFFNSVCIGKDEKFHMYDKEAIKFEKINGKIRMSEDYKSFMAAGRISFPDHIPEVGNQVVFVTTSLLNTMFLNALGLNSIAISPYSSIKNHHLKMFNKSCVFVGVHNYDYTNAYDLARINKLSESCDFVMKITEEEETNKELLDIKNEVEDEISLVNHVDYSMFSIIDREEVETRLLEIESNMQDILESVYSLVWAKDLSEGKIEN